MSFIKETQEVGEQKRVSKVKKTNNETLYSDQAYLFLKKMILEMNISPKEILSESKLASMVGMSRTPVREALKRLKNENILISSDRRGYFINIPTVKEIKDLYEVRTILEGGAVKLAAQKINLEKLRVFEKKFLSYKNAPEKKGGKDGDFVKLGREFHFFIIDSAENEKLKELIGSIYDQLEISRIYSYGRRGGKAVDEHLKIVNALKERDEEKSQLSMEEHLKNAFEVLIKIL